MAKILSASDIFSTEDNKLEKVDVPEWGGAVYVQGLTGRQRDAFELGVMEYNQKGDNSGVQNIRARLVAWCAVDEKGGRIFKDSDVARLGNKSAVALNRVFEVAQRLSGMTPSDIEEMAGN